MGGLALAFAGQPEQFKRARGIGVFGPLDRIGQQLHRAVEVVVLDRLLGFGGKPLGLCRIGFAARRAAGNRGGGRGRFGRGGGHAGGDTLGALIRRDLDHPGIGEAAGQPGTSTVGFLARVEEPGAQPVPALRIPLELRLVDDPSDQRLLLLRRERAWLGRGRLQVDHVEPRRNRILAPRTTGAGTCLGPRFGNAYHHRFGRQARTDGEFHVAGEEQRQGRSGRIVAFVFDRAQGRNGFGCAQRFAQLVGIEVVERTEADVQFAAIARERAEHLDLDVESHRQGGAASGALRPDV